MKAIFKSFLMVALLVCFATYGSAADEEKDAKTKAASKSDDAWKISWNNGFKFVSPDGQHSLKLGGRIMNDWAWGSAGDDLPEFVSSNEFRRARLFVSGTVYKYIEFKAQYDFAGGDADVKDMWMAIKGLPFGTFKVGHHKVPFSLEELTSSKYITFMERAIPVELFSPSRETGFGIFGHSGDTATWGFGVYTDADDYGEAEHDDAYFLAGRLTFLPWYDEGDLIHLGGAVVWQDIADGGDVRFRSRPEVHLYTRLINTDHFDADSVMKFGLEGAAIMGSFHASGEYMMANVDSADAGDPSFQSFYVSGGYYLTGERRNYKTSAGAFDRTKVKSAFNPDEGGMGAWEIAARYSWADLNDADIFGGEQMDFTLALNWYLTNNTVWKFNYVYADVDELSDGTFNAFQVRFQIDF